MDLWKLFLTERQEQKLNLLEDIISRTEASIDELACKHSLTNRNVKSLIMQINEDYIENTSTTDALIRFENRLFRISTLKATGTYPSLYSNLKITYIKQSAVFQVLIYFLRHRKVGMIKLSTHFNYSQSYCYKLVNRANDIIRSMGIECQISKRMNYLIVEGRESQIRMLSYILNSHSTTFAEDNNYLYRNEKSPTKIQRDNLSRITRIFLDAHKMGHYTDVISDQEMSIGLCLYEELHLSFSQTFYPLNKKINDAAFQSEKFLYYLFAVYFFPEFLTPEICERLGAGLMRLTKNPIVDRAVEALEKMEENYSIPDNLHRTFVFQLVYRFLITDKLSLSSFFYLEDKKLLMNDKFLTIKEMLKSVYKESISERDLDIFGTQLTELLYSYVGHVMAKPLHVMIHITYHANYAVLVKNYITGVYKPETVTMVGNFADADLVISDRFVESKENQYFFFLEDIHNIETWKRLGEFINSKIIEGRIRSNTIEKIS